MGILRDTYIINDNSKVAREINIANCLKREEIEQQQTISDNNIKSKDRVNISREEYEKLRQDSQLLKQFKNNDYRYNDAIIKLMLNNNINKLIIKYDYDLIDKRLYIQEKQEFVLSFDFIRVYNPECASPYPEYRSVFKLDKINK